MCVVISKKIMLAVSLPNASLSPGASGQSLTGEAKFPLEVSGLHKCAPYCLGCVAACRPHHWSAAAILIGVTREQAMGQSESGSLTGTVNLPKPGWIRCIMAVAESTCGRWLDVDVPKACPQGLFNGPPCGHLLTAQQQVASHACCTA